MIALGILLCLYAVASWVYQIMGYQLILLYWMHTFPAWAQWSIRGALLAAGVVCIVIGWRRRRELKSRS